jgi:hypothetical protein
MYLPVLVEDDAESQRNEWRVAFEKVLEGLRKLKPEVVVVSVGLDGLAVDAHVSPAGVGKLEEEDYVWAFEQLKGLGCKLLVVLEGGYALTGLSTGPFARTMLALVRGAVQGRPLLPIITAPSAFDQGCPMSRACQHLNSLPSWLHNCR